MEYRATRQGAAIALQRAQRQGLPEWAVKYCRELIQQADTRHAKSRETGLDAEFRKKVLAGRAEKILGVISLVSAYERYGRELKPLQGLKT